MSKGFTEFTPEQRSEISRKAALKRFQSEPLEVRFWNYVNKNSGIFALVNGEISECWLWTGSLSGKGYAYMSVNNRSKQAYKIGYELTKGPVPAGLELDHLCRTKNCVRPDHLESVTRVENQRRSPLTLAGMNIRKTHCPNGHPYDGINKAGSRTCSACCREARHRYYVSHVDTLRQ